MPLTRIEADSRDAFVDRHIGPREAELSALFLKGRAVLERGFPDAEAKP